MPTNADPLRVTLEGAVATQGPSDTEALKDTDGLSGTGSPQAGRSSINEALEEGPLGLVQVLGPGLITGASDDDPSGIGTYSQVGSQFGYGLLWTALFTFPLMSAVQELCGRIALQTGVGLGVSLRRKFPTPLVGGAVLLLLIANTINIGADLGAVAAGGALLTRDHVPALALVVPAALLIVGFQLFSTFARLVSIFKWLTLALFAYVITAFASHPQGGEVVLRTFVPHVELSRDFIAAIVAILGTTISPYLFFWQASSEVEEMKAAGKATERERRGVKDRELAAARLDILTGMAFSQAVMFCIIVTSAAVLNAHGHTSVQSAQEAASTLEPLAGPFAFVLFSAGLIGTGLLAIPVLSGSAAYALKEFFGFGGSLAVKPRYRPTFYAVILVATAVGVILNFVGVDPIRALFITAVINGIVAPPLLLLIVLLGSDRTVMRERVSRGLSRTLGWVATLVMSAAAIALLVTLLPLPR